MADLRGECVCHPRRSAPLNAAIAQEEFDRERRVTLGIASSWVPVPDGFGPMMQPATVFDMTTERFMSWNDPQAHPGWRERKREWPLEGSCTNRTY